MCGIVGIVGTSEVAAQLYDGLTVLQHRGQDAAGIATTDRHRLRVQKGNGLVRDVFNAESDGACSKAAWASRTAAIPPPVPKARTKSQPFYVNSPYGIALAHNGNLMNTDALRREVFEQDRRNVNTESDSEVLLNVFAHELDTQKALTPDSVFRAVEGVNRRAKGGYAVVLRGARPRPGRVPRSARHPPARARQAHLRRAATSSASRPNRSRSTCSASSACATSRPAKRS